MQRYFDKFPTIVYNGYTVKNIMARVKILDKVTESPDLFNNYQITNAVRADNLSYNIYGDQYFSWLVYLSNNIVDPYYDWNLSQYDFDQFIIEKYGSFAGAQGKVAYWNNNWYDNTAPITVGAYAILADYAKKYYEPVFGGKQIIEYKRRENDWIVNTNQIWEYTVNADLNLQLDEKVTISNSSGSAVANGQVLFANSTVVRIHQVFGTSNTQTGTITGSGNTANVSAATLIAKNISDEERVYWSEITYYDVEDIKNSAKQNIRLISPQFSMQTALELKRSFS